MTDPTTRITQPTWSRSIRLCAHSPLDTIAPDGEGESTTSRSSTRQPCSHTTPSTRSRLAMSTVFRIALGAAWCCSGLAAGAAASVAPPRPRPRPLATALPTAFAAARRAVTRSGDVRLSVWGSRWRRRVRQSLRQPLRLAPRSTLPLLRARCGRRRPRARRRDGRREPGFCRAHRFAPACTTSVRMFGTECIPRGARNPRSDDEVRCSTSRRRCRPPRRAVRLCAKRLQANAGTVRSPPTYSWIDRRPRRGVSEGKLDLSNAATSRRCRVFLYLAYAAGLAPALSQRVGLVLEPECSPVDPNHSCPACRLDCHRGRLHLRKPGVGGFPVSRPRTARHGGDVAHRTPEAA